MDKNDDVSTRRMLGKGQTFFGITMLDGVTGGFLNGELIILAGCPGSGKTTLALNVARINSVDFVSDIAYFSIDTSARKIISKFEQSYTKSKKDNSIKYSHLFTLGSFHLEDFTERCKYLKQEFDVRMIMVDYLELETGSENDILKEIKSLKNLAVRLNVPILVVINMIDDNEKQPFHFPKLMDLGKVGLFADMVLFINKAVKESSTKKHYSEIAVAKNPAEKTGIVKLRYEPDSGLMFDDSQYFDGNKFWTPT